MKITVGENGGEVNSNEPYWPITVAGSSGFFMTSGVLQHL